MIESGPKKLYVEPTMKCNLNCKMCVRNVLSEKIGNMSLETYKRLLDVFSDLSLLNLSGYGEPLLNKDIFTMIKLAKANLSEDATVACNTNATQISEKVAEKLVQSGIDKIVVSMDGAHPETFEKIRVGANFYQVLKSVERLNRAKVQFRSETPQLGFEFVVMKCNVSELPQFMELADSYGASFVVVSNLLPHTEIMKDQILYELNSEFAIKIFEKAKLRAQELGISLNLSQIMAYLLRGARELITEPELRELLKLSKFSVEYVDSRQFDLLCNMLDKVESEAFEQGREINIINLAAMNEGRLKWVDKIFEETKSRAKELGISLSLPRLIPKNERECNFVKSGGCWVSWDGYVRPCHQYSHSYLCYIFNRVKFISSVSFGNVLIKDLIEIWNSEKYKEFRLHVSKFDFPSCEDCIYVDSCWFIGASDSDCWMNENPCSACLWSRDILQC